MEQEQEIPPEDSDRNNRCVSVNALRRETKSLLSALLNPEKIIRSDKGYPRDWHGLAELCGIAGEKIPSLVRTGDPSYKILEIWGGENDSTIDKLLSYLEDLDRFDIIDDITPLLDQDIEIFHRNPNGFVVEPPHIDDTGILTIDDIRCKEQGLSPQTYDAFVLFADDDIDFSTELLETMEKQYNLKLCVKHRDLVGGTIEHDSIVQLISNRCGRLVVVMSPAFFKSPANKFFCSFAQALGIEQRKRKIIPCLYKECTSLPPDLGIYFLLDYVRCSKFCNFWDKLHLSIVATQAPAISEPPAKPIKVTKSVETNHVKFDTNEIRSTKLPTVKEALPVEEITIPTSSCESVDPTSMEIQKKKSLYKRIVRLKSIFRPKCTNKKVEGQEESTKANGFADENKKKNFKSLKMKVALAN